MMKRQKIQLIVLAVLAVLCIGGYLILKNYNSEKEKEEEAKSSGEEVLTIDSDKITAFSYEYEGETLHFIKTDDVWVNEENESVNLDGEKIEEMLANIKTVSADQVLSDVSDLSEYGLVKPTNVISVTADGTDYSFYVGDYNSTASCYYFMTNMSQNVYTMQDGLCTGFAKSILELQKEESVSDNTTS